MVAIDADLRDWPHILLTRLIVMSDGLQGESRAHERAEDPKTRDIFFLKRGWLFCRATDGGKSAIKANFDRAKTYKLGHLGHGGNFITLRRRNSSRGYQFLRFRLPTPDVCGGRFQMLDCDGDGRRGFT